MSKQTKVTMMMAYLFALFILIFDVVVMILAAAGVLSGSSSVYLFAIILNLFVIYEVYTGIRTLIRHAKAEIAAEMAAEETAPAEETGDE